MSRHKRHVEVFGWQASVGAVDRSLNRPDASRLPRGMSDGDGDSDPDLSIEEVQLGGTRKARIAPQGAKPIRSAKELTARGERNRTELNWADGGQTHHPGIWAESG
eukprot:gene14820-biopygen20136